MHLEPTKSHRCARSTSEENCDKRVVSRVISLRKTWEQVAKLPSAPWYCVAFMSANTSLRRDVKVLVTLTKV
jgi:hypothetical protein